MAMTDTRYDRLIAAASEYRALAQENYVRIRALAEALQTGFCAFLNSSRPPCALLVPSEGPFEPKNYGDKAFSMPSEGFQLLTPIKFGLAVRISEDNEWLRVTLGCMKEGETFSVTYGHSGHYRFTLPLGDQDPTQFFEDLYDHVLGFFTRAIDEYEHGRYGQQDIGFDFSPPRTEAT